jgi:hypothetical protein
MSGGPEKPKSEIIPVTDHTELEKKARIRRGFEDAKRAFDTALDGRGALLPNITEEQRTWLSSARAEIDQLSRDVMSNPLERDASESAARVMRQIKIDLLPYLSDKQFEEIFGSDKV